MCEIDPGNGAIRVNDSSKPDYESITELILTVSVSDEHDRENSHGLLLRFQNENPYKVALLASSDHPLEQLWPKLEVHYSISE